MIATAPRIYVVENFLSPMEASSLIKLGVDQLSEAVVMGPDGTSRDRQLEARNASTTALLEEDGGEFLSSVLDRIHNTALMPRSHGQLMQLTRYEIGQHYGIHKDSSDKVGRSMTFLIFLSDVEKGGELIFPWASPVKPFPQGITGVAGSGRPLSELANKKKTPKLQPFCIGEKSKVLNITPRVGRAVFWFNHHPDLSVLGHEMMHGSCPVQAGTKYVAQRWITWFEQHVGNDDVSSYHARAGSLPPGVKLDKPLQPQQDASASVHSGKGSSPVDHAMQEAARRGITDVRELEKFITQYMKENAR